MKTFLAPIATVLRQMSWPPILLAALLLGLAPFSPMPHVMEKTIMLANGTLTRPIDMFDLLFHLSPCLLIGAKLVAGTGEEK